MQPMMKTTALLTSSAHTGMPSSGWTRRTNLEPMSALSLAKDHVSLDAVCCTALSAAKAATSKMATKAVAAVPERVA